MKKKNLIACFAVGAALSCAFGFAACDGDDNGNNGGGANGAHTHEYTETVIAPTCTEKGYTLYTCTGCNESYKDNYVNALGHNYTANICTVCYGVDPAAPDTEGLIFTLNEDGKSYTLSGRGTASGDYLKIPATYNGKPVTEVGEYVFDNCSWQFEALYIPDTVKIIGEYAFCGCEQLKGLTIPDSVTEICNDAFEDCPIEQISWGSGLTKIGEWAFSNTAVKKVTIPDSVTKIGDGAFILCENLTDLKLGSGVTYIGGGLYASCPNLKNVYLDKNIKNYILEDGVLYDKDKVTLLCYNPHDTQEVFTVPYGVRTIGTGAFVYSSYKSIVLPSSVISIDESAFSACEFTQITLSENLTTIGDGAFEDCEALETLVITDKVTEIGDWAFGGCESLKTVTLPASLTKIGGHAFESCSAFNEIIFKGTTEQWKAISKDEYWSRDVGDFTVNCTNGTLDKNESGAHTHNYVETVFAPTCTEKGYTLYTCTGCNESYKGNYVNALSHTYTNYICTSCYCVDPAAPDTQGLSFTLNEDGKSYTLSGRGTASGDYLKIPATYNGKPVTEVRNNAFDNCSWQFEALYIPDTVKIIGEYAFDCEQLKGLTIPDSVTEICQGAFGYTALEKVTIPDSVTKIGDGAFILCENLTDLKLGSGVTYIGGGLYAGCTNLRNIYLDKNIKNYVLEDGVLYDKDKVTLLCCNQRDTQEVFTVPYGVRTIGFAAFVYSSYKIIILPSSVTAIDEVAFAGCESLTQINLPENLTTIGDGAFQCPAIETLVIPDKVTEIGNNAFEACESLKTVTLPASLTNIGSSIFESCSAFNEVIFKGTIQQWNAISKDAYWNYGVGDFTVRCTDGTLDKNGNVVE